MTQAELAESVGCCRSCISQYERGYCKPRTYHLPKLARALNCTIDELFDEDLAKEAQSDQEDPERVCGNCKNISHGSVNYPRTCDLTLLYTCASQRACSNFEKRGDL